MRLVGAAIVLGLLVVGCTDEADPPANTPAATGQEADRPLPRFEQVAGAAEEQLGKCGPDCAARAPYLGISRLTCRSLSHMDATCRFVAFRRRFDLGLDDHGFDSAEGAAQRCSIVMRRGFGEHDDFWVDAVADPLRRRETSTIRCAAMATRR